MSHICIITVITCFWHTFCPKIIKNTDVDIRIKVIVPLEVLDDDTRECKILEINAVINMYRKK